ncbi:MAG: hypothetical protein KJO31_12900 [Gammaproteobacteria bacterium]|nr:hypothetical protein [Gammaproteobacteria bacterium]
MTQRMLQTLGKTLRRLMLLSLIACAAGCAQKFTVKPLPNFVDAAIKPGDKVEVTTYGGESWKFEVTGVTKTALHGREHKVRLVEIADLKKIARKRPPSPCGGEKELGCSVPILISMASNEHAHYRERFYDACAQHDYCYRHGSATYGLDRDDCDEEFLVNMQNSCPNQTTSVFGTVVEIMGNSIDSSFTCMRIANDFYTAARDFGEKHFEAKGSSYCEYNGPPGRSALIPPTR